MLTRCSIFLLVRSLTAYFTTLFIFGFVFAWAPADDWRAPVAAVITGAIGGAILQQKIPGWELLMVGSAFTAVGAMHILAPSQWLWQSLLPIPSMLCWYWGDKLGDDLLTSLKDPHAEPNRLFSVAELRREERRGFLVVLWTACGSFVMLAPLAPGAHWLALPVAFTLSFAVAVKWHIRRRFWPALGFLIALPLSGWTNICLNNFFKLPPLQLPDPWLSSGLLIIGSILGLWLAAWYSVNLKKISGHSLNR